MKVVVEGGDAAGKYTQTMMLAERLPAKRFAFPNYESPTGSIILAHLKKWWKCKPDGGREWGEADMEHLDARVFQSLQTVNRIELLPQIEAAAFTGNVVFDRYWQSAYVYGSLDGLDPEWLRLVQEHPMPVADINILIDVPVEEGFKRRPERRDRYEMNRDFLEKVRTKYLELWSSHAGRGWFVLDGTKPVDAVHQTIMEIVAKTQTGVF